MTIVKQKPVYLNHLFDDLFSNLSGETANVPFRTPVNIHETQDGFHVEINAPGREKNDFHVVAENGLLTISYENKQETKDENYKTICREFNYQSFKRSFQLTEKVNTENIQAKYENGILKLYLPKKEEAKAVSKQIEIK